MTFTDAKWLLKWTRQKNAFESSQQIFITDPTNTSQCHSLLTPVNTQRPVFRAPALSEPWPFPSHGPFRDPLSMFEPLLFQQALLVGFPLKSRARALPVKRAGGPWLVPRFPGLRAERRGHRRPLAEAQDPVEGPQGVPGVQQRLPLGRRDKLGYRRPQGRPPTPRLHLGCCCCCCCFCGVGGDHKGPPKPRPLFLGPSFFFFFEGPKTAFAASGWALGFLHSFT